MIIFDNDRNPNHQIVQDQWYLIEPKNWYAPFAIAKYDGELWEVEDSGDFIQTFRPDEVLNYAKIE